jgi:hypothetical protein
LELPLDARQCADHLRVYYGRCGFGLVETAQLGGKFYLSVVLSKPIASPVRRSGQTYGQRSISPRLCGSHVLRVRAGAEAVYQQYEAAVSCIYHRRGYIGGSWV